MPHPVIAALVGLTACVVSWLTVRWLRDAALRLNFVGRDPGGRHVHTGPLPRIGGLGIVTGFSVALAVSFALPVERFPVEIERIVLLVIGMLIIAGSMFFDDILGLRPLPKLLLQFGAALLIVLPRLRDAEHGIVISQFDAPFIGTAHLPLLVALGFTLFWIVGMMNAVNWSDGVDGLVGTVALIAGSVLFVHAYFRPEGDPQFTISLLAIAFVGAVLGFLPHNWHPSRIIMGDSGAMSIGFLLAAISIVGGAKIATALLALGVPILDTAWVIVYRVINGRSPGSADRGHLHHRLLDAGLTQPQVVACFGGLTALFGVLSLALPTREHKFVAMLIMGVVLVSFFALLARRQSSAERQHDARRHRERERGGTTRADL